MRRTDPGRPEVCPVFAYHKLFSTPEVVAWSESGCRSAGIGCLDCKQPVVDAVLNELRPIQERIAEYSGDPNRVRNIIADGSEAARAVARATLDEVRQAMGLNYR